MKIKRKEKYNLLESFAFAFRGIAKAVKKERNLKIHLGAGSLAVLLGLVLRISALEWLVLLLIIALIISLEIMNASIEAVCDLIRFKLKLSYWETYWIRNFAAGAVMILALASVIIGLIIFGPKIVKKAFAQEVEFMAEKDTYVDSEYPEQNFGQAKELLFGFSHSTEVIFLKFDLSKLAPLAINQKATLNLWLEESTGSFKPVEVEILLPEKDWSENDLNWNNKPSLFSSEISATIEATPGAQPIDLTPLLEKWQDGSLENHGIALYYNSEKFEKKFGSREHEKKPPLLIISETSAYNFSSETEVEKAPLKTEVRELKSEVKGVETKRKPKNPYASKFLAIGLWILGLGVLVANRFVKIEE